MMKDKMKQLLYMAFSHDASDIHFVVRQNKLFVTMRTMYGLQEMHSAAFDISLFNYLKFLANMDLASGNQAQCGNFSYTYENKQYQFRFSLLTTLQKQTGVLRILYAPKHLDIYHLSYQQQQTQSFLRWTNAKSGMIIFCGPTGSGKTTTLHAILHEIAIKKQLRVVSLEDPVEILDDTYLQLQINEQALTYEEGLRQLLRHDPDVIMLGEVRDANTARMLFRCALSGHMVFTTIHAKSCFEGIKRLEEFGVKTEELQGTLSAICAQRIFKSKKEEGRVCIYEILEQEELSSYLSKKEVSKQYQDIFQRITQAVFDGYIEETEAAFDLATS